ncbi:MAG: hypothetical protein HC778_00065 [Chamaesiphon sp. CSU_1_12]|nr:hypothetical protein [Chamaesiphon sp. CSU_1_12]
MGRRLRRVRMGVKPILTIECTIETNMDLSELSDDALLQLIQFTAAETKHRAISVKYAADRSWQDTKDDIQAQIELQEQAAAQKAAQTNNNIKATIAELLTSLSFWQVSKYTVFTIEKIDKSGEIQLQIRFGRELITYYATGNKWGITTFA